MFEWPLKTDFTVPATECRTKHPGVTVSFFPSQFFPRGKNGPAYSFPGEKTDRSVFSPGERFD